MLSARREIAKLDRRITLLQEVMGSSISGGPNITGYELLDNDPEPYARVRNKLGGEVVQNDQITHIQQSVFTVRYRTDINLSVKIVHENKMYAIHSYAESGETRRAYLDITAEYVKEYVLT
jgi:head-tail adaptor